MRLTWEDSRTDQHLIKEQYANHTQPCCSKVGALYPSLCPFAYVCVVQLFAKLQKKCVIFSISQTFQLKDRSNDTFNRWAVSPMKIYPPMLSICLCTAATEDSFLLTVDYVSVSISINSPQVFWVLWHRVTQALRKHDTVPGQCMLVCVACEGSRWCVWQWSWEQEVLGVRWTVTHWDEMRKGNHILAFSDSVEKQILHTGHQSAPIDTNKTNCSVSFALRARSCASSLMSTTFSKEKTLASIQV